MNPIITYETVRAETGDVKVFAVMNMAFFEKLGAADADRLFPAAEGRYAVLSQDEKTFAVVVDGDLHEKGLTEAIDIVQDKGTQVEIRTDSIENRLGFGTDINPTAHNLVEALQHVETWLNAGVFAPKPAETFDFPA